MVNLRLQKAILEAVENQIRENDPPETEGLLSYHNKAQCEQDNKYNCILHSPFCI